MDLPRPQSVAEPAHAREGQLFGPITADAAVVSSGATDGRQENSSVFGMLTAGAVVTLEGAATDGLRALLFGWGHLQEGVIYFAASLLAIHRGRIS